MKKLLLAFAAAWGLALLAIAYQFSQNGRYQLSGSEWRVIDTRTGAVYQKDRQSGRLKIHWTAPEK